MSFYYEICNFCGHEESTYPRYETSQELPNVDVDKNFCKRCVGMKYANPAVYQWVTDIIEKLKKNEI